MGGTQGAVRDGDAAAALDVAIVGAGLSGICAACRLAISRPQDRVRVFEARAAMGGTWDLFRYPGVRSDSDMHTLGYGFRPWRGAAIADGPSILAYIRETAAAHGIGEKIAYGAAVRAADWSREDALWTLTLEDAGGGETRRARARFVFFCTGYYDYDAGHAPDLPGRARFAGPVAHPQSWPEGLALAGRRVALIGSGATAVTLAPALARAGAQVTMIQRTPSYIAALPSRDAAAAWLGRVLPARPAHALARAKNIALSMTLYQAARLAPGRVRAAVLRAARAALGPGHDVETHFNPPYDPWDQRFCLAPDGDFFDAVRAGRVEMITSAAERFTETGLRLADGREVAADLVVTATGLRLKMMGGIAFSVDGAAQPISERVAYKGAMMSDLPNAVFTLGYVNASWTLKCELIVRWAIRLLDHMEARGFASATPRPPADLARRPLIPLSSGYIARSRDVLPSQGDRAPWRVRQNYLRDLLLFRLAPVADAGLRFAPPPRAGASGDAAPRRPEG